MPFGLVCFKIRAKPPPVVRLTSKYHRTFDGGDIWGPLSSYWMPTIRHERHNKKKEPLSGSFFDSRSRSRLVLDPAAHCVLDLGDGLGHMDLARAGLGAVEGGAAAEGAAVVAEDL